MATLLAVIHRIAQYPKLIGPLKQMSSLKSLNSKAWKVSGTGFSVLQKSILRHSRCTSRLTWPSAESFQIDCQFRRNGVRFKSESRDVTSSQTKILKQPYTVPISGILARLPASWVPFAELIRLDNPTGAYYLFFPCLFSSLMAAPMLSPAAPLPVVMQYSCLFFFGAFIMRGAGCSINDIWDRNFDIYVTRTQLRPIARGAIKPKDGVLFFGCQLMAGLAVLIQFPLPCILYGAMSIPLIILYPLAKRVTHYPQLVLGLAFSWGAFMGFPAIGIDLLSQPHAFTAATCLYGSNVAWTVLYDTIYAHMDATEDESAGIRSIVLRHKAKCKPILSSMATIQVFLLMCAGFASGAGPLFFLGSCGGVASVMGIMVRKIKLHDAQNCWWWFRNGCWMSGLAVTLGLAADYLQRAVFVASP